MTEGGGEGGKGGKGGERGKKGELGRGKRTIEEDIKEEEMGIN